MPPTQPQQMMDIRVDDFVDGAGNHLVSLMVGRPPLTMSLILPPTTAEQLGGLLIEQAKQSKVALVVPPRIPS